MAYGSHRGRSFRGRLQRRRHDSEEDNLYLDLTRDPSEITREVLTHLVKQDISKGHKLSYLNSFVKLCSKISDNTVLGFSNEEIFCCLRVVLFHESCEVRAAGLRVIRYLLRDKAAVCAFCHVQLPLLVCRCLDIMLDNRLERIQALRLVRKLLSVDPYLFPRAFTNCLVAIANDGIQDRDLLVKACLATLSELALVNPEACITSGGFNAILRSVLDCYQPQISEALLGVILYLLNHPKTRCLVKGSVGLEHLVAPFTDCHYCYSGDISESSLSDDRSSRFNVSKLAIIAVLRSWPGMIYMCNPDNTGLQSLVDMLYLPYTEIRKNIMDLLYDLFCLVIPEWTEDFSLALLSADPSTAQETWKLYDGFVSAEGEAILPHVAKSRTNLVVNYFALLLFAFVHAGLLEALVEVVISSETKISVRATVLLGELLHLANRMLPPDYSHRCNCLPTLMAVAVSFESSPHQRNQASAAISCLHRIHELKKCGPIPYSLALDQQLHFCNSNREKTGYFWSSVSRTKLWQCLRKETEDQAVQTLKDTQVLLKDYSSWDWDLIGSILKSPIDSMKKLEDTNYRSFIKKIVMFYKPSCKQFSTIEADKEFGYQLCVVGCHLLDFLLEADESKSSEFLEDFLLDLNQCLSQISTENAPLHDVLSPSKLISTLSHAYFIFIGRLSSTRKGQRYLDKSCIYQYLLELVSVTSHDTYIKLVVSTLDYSKEGFSRIILSKVLTATSENARLYATKFLRVLLRASLPDFRKWAVELLVTQLYDKSQAVSLSAADILDEACDIKENLEALISLRPSLLHIGDKGLLLLLRFLSVPTGFRFLRDTNFLGHELERWNKLYNLKYVKIVEDMLNEALSRHRRGEDGTYGRHSSSDKYAVKNVFIPPHMYGQLVQHQDGLDLLVAEGCFPPLFQEIIHPSVSTEYSALRLKAALWTVGHIGTSPLGLPLLQKADVIPHIIRLTEECPVLSIRGTCFYVLGLLASLPDGADLLSNWGWEAMRRTHKDNWPLLKEAVVEDFLGDDRLSQSWSISSGGSEWPAGNLRSSLSFVDRTPEKNLLLSTSSCCSLDLDDGVAEDKDVISSSRTLPRSTTFLAHHCHSSGDLRPRSSSDCQADSHRINELQQAMLSEHDDNWDSLCMADVAKDRSSSFSGSRENEQVIIRERCVNSLEILNQKPQFFIRPKEERSSSNESSHTSGTKSHSGSSESATSGISSWDSSIVRPYFSEHAQTLSPIASSTSLNTMASKMTSECAHQPTVLPSQKLSCGLHISSSLHSPNTPEIPQSYTFTSARDALGFVTLRGIQSKRGQSQIFDTDKSLDSFVEYQNSRSHSLDPRLGNYFSLGDDYITSVINEPHRRSSLCSQSSAPAAVGTSFSLSDSVQEEGYYIGLCLPGSCTMIFSLKEENHEQDDQLCNIQPAKLEEAVLDTGLEFHNKTNCLACHKVNFDNTEDVEVTCNLEELTLQESFAVRQCESPFLSERNIKSRASSIDSTQTATPCSLTSAGSMELLNKHRLSEDDPQCLILIRKEVMRIVTNLSSSVGVKACEQGLLNLKQKFPNAFQDMCLYTEVSLHMACYNFRLPARRFLQELFLDLSFEQLLQHAHNVLDQSSVNNFSQFGSSDA